MSGETPLDSCIRHYAEQAGVTVRQLPGGRYDAAEFDQVQRELYQWYLEGVPLHTYPEFRKLARQAAAAPVTPGRVLEHKYRVAA